tara:strand:- start:3011 stop:4363 length:1353 start_codon:yes stop_codon:yes gene_type:complete
MQTDLVSVVFPVYDLGGDRLNNFCHALHTIYTLDLCEIVVAEQTSSNTNIQRLLHKYTEVRHLAVNIEGDVFNKSKIINQAVTQVSSKYIWIVDGDFYADYGFIIASISQDYDFIRPFSHVVMLNDTETDELQESGNVLIEREKYETNSADGKYSFIVRRDIFIKSGMMNEDFHGWGFQDLDFVHNRLVECRKTYVDTIGFHMHHSPASRQYVNRNKRLYMNLSGDESVSEYDNDIQTTTVKEDPPPETNHTITEEIQTTANISRIPNYVEKVEPMKMSHIHHTTKSTPKFPTTPYTHLLKSEDHYVVSYIEYIINNYDNLEGGYVFSTELFINTPKMFGIFTTKRILDILDSGCLNFTWISEQSRLRLCEGHMANVTKSQHPYEYWVELYTELVPRKSPKYSLAGVFCVSSTEIKRQPLEFYTRIQSQMCTWVEEDYVFFLATLENIFT